MYKIFSFFDNFNFSFLASSHWGKIPIVVQFDYVENLSKHYLNFSAKIRSFLRWLNIWIFAHKLQMFQNICKKSQIQLMEKKSSLAPVCVNRAC